MSEQEVHKHIRAALDASEDKAGYVARLRALLHELSSTNSQPVVVGIRAMPAAAARKLVAALAVLLLGVTAHAALPGSIARIDEADRHPNTPRLVGDLPLQIAKGPGVESLSLWPRSPYPLAYAFEVFEGNAALGAFGRSNDLLGDDVVRVAREALLLPPSLLEEPLRALGPLLLELLTKPFRATPERVELLSGEVVPVRCRGDVGDANVNPEPPQDLLLLCIRDFNGHEEVEAVVAENEVRFSAIISEKLSLALPADEWHSLPAFDSPHARGVPSPREDALVVGNGPEWAECALALVAELVGVGHLRNSAHDHLARQIREGGTTLSVHQVLEGKLPEGLCLEGAPREPRGRLVSAANRGCHGRTLCRCRLELDLGDQLHSALLYHIQALKGSALPWPGQ